MEGWESKEISLKSLAYIIQARMEEIIDYVMYQIENSGFYDKVGSGIVLTGGGALLKDLPQLIKLRTGMDVRLGIPFKEVVANMPEMALKPMYSTSIGLLLSALEQPQMRIMEPSLFDDVEPIQQTETKKSTRNERNKSKKTGSDIRPGDFRITSYNVCYTKLLRYLRALLCLCCIFPSSFWELPWCLVLT